MYADLLRFEALSRASSSAWTLLSVVRPQQRHTSDVLRKRAHFLAVPSNRVWSWQMDRFVFQTFLQCLFTPVIHFRSQIWSHLRFFPFYFFMLFLTWAGWAVEEVGRLKWLGFWLLTATSIELNNKVWLHFSTVLMAKKAGTVLCWKSIHYPWITTFSHVKTTDCKLFYLRF